MGEWLFGHQLHQLYITDQIGKNNLKRTLNTIRKKVASIVGSDSFPHIALLATER
jgi:hypothetical protein